MVDTWTSVTGIPGGLTPDTVILLTDGSLLVHHSGGKAWYRLTPDDQGRYESGSWSAAAINMANTRQFFASGVLMDGRVFAIGGEYSDAGNATPLGEIFDPTTNTWSALTKPSAFSFINSDAVSCVLADGRVLFGSPGGNRTAIWDPVIDLWSEAGLAFGSSATPTKAGNTNEESWSLMPDGTVLAVQIVGAPAAEKYVPSTDRWVSAGNTSGTLPLVSLNDPVTKTTVTIKEIGPGITLADGRCFFVGGTGRTGLYTQPVAPAQAGTWAAGPNLPVDTTANKYNQANGNLQTAIDAPGTLLPNGRVLFIAGNTVRELDSKGNPQFWSNPCTHYVFDPQASTITALSKQPSNNGVDTWKSRLLTLPTGQVAFTAQQSGVMQILTLDPATAAPNNAWRPTIASAPSTMLGGHTYIVTGTQFNGLSQTSSYGDDAGVATNFPIVQLRRRGSNKVVHLRSFNFSSLGIATGTTPQTASVEVPVGTTPGQYDLVVIANGIASAPVTVRVAEQDCFFVIDRSTFGQGEIQALINLSGTPAVIDPALYVVVEGFTASELGLTHSNLGSPPHVPTVTSAVAGMSFAFSGTVIPQDPTLPPHAQRFTFPFRVAFQNTSMFGFTPTTANVGITAALSAAGSTVNAAAMLQLVRNPNPYILHGDTAHGGDWYLSVDIRVFQVKAGQTRFAAHVGTSGGARTVATTFIQQVITNLNGSPASAGALFDALPSAEDVATLALSPTDSGGTAVYNFALARVRYRETVPASNVRVFFRMWPAQQTNATYNTNTLYRSATNSAAQRIPLLGVHGDEIMTIPFFATPRVDTTTASMRSQTDAPNVRPISPDAIGGEVATYFGCWLDINQPSDRVLPARLVGPTPANLPDGPFTGMGQLLPIQQLVRSAHQCLIAEISFDPVQIPANADPSTSDKLAQRNLTFVNVPNPGLVDSRRAPQPFEVRPTPPQFPPDLPPDELMLEWGHLPSDATASIYLPAADADEILDLAGQLFDSHRLTKLDDHTLSCPTGGATFVPIPRGADPNFAGLLSVELPAGIRSGQVHQVTVRQITTALARIPRQATHELDTAPPAVKGAVAGADDEPTEAPPATIISKTFASKQADIDWRRVLGIFNLTIPVATKSELLAPEERLLSTLRWIQQAIPLENRWFLVFQRYVDQIADRVLDMGGDPDRVRAHPNGDWDHKIEHHDHKDDQREHDREEREHDREEREHDREEREHDREEREERREARIRITGKIASLEYNRYGAYEAFLLDTEDGLRRFEGREAELEELAERAWRERTTVSVYAERHDPDRPLRIVLHAASAALED